MSQAVEALVPRKLIGISSDVRGNGMFVDEGHIMYACEKSLLNYDLKKKTAEVEIGTFMKDRNITSFSINIDRSLIGLGTDGFEPMISLYERRGARRVMSSQVHFGGGAGSVSFLDFSAGGGYLAAVLKPPHRLCVYSLRRRAVALNLRFTHIHGRLTRRLHQVHFNPSNDNVLLLVGDGVLRIYRLRLVVKSDECEVRFKTMGFRQTKELPLTCGCWYDRDRVLAATRDGRFLVLENCLIKGIYFIDNLQRVFIPSRPPHVKVRECINWVKVAQKKLNEQCSIKKQIYQVGFFEKGFVIGSEKIIIYEEPLDKPRWFIRSKVLDIETQTVPKIFLNIHSHSTNRLITCCTQSKNICLIDLNNSLVSCEGLENVSAGSGRVSRLATCLWKPICLSVSGLSLTLWNYVSGTVINTWTFQESPGDVSLHPTGSMFSLILERELCIFSIEHDHTYAHHYRSCGLHLHVFYEETFLHCTFSNGGAYLGGATSKKIYIFSSTSFKILNVFEVDSLLIQSTIDDMNDTMTSVSSDGLKIRHNLQTGKLLSKCKHGDGREYTEFAADQTLKLLYIIASDGICTKVNYSDVSKVATSYSMNLGRLVSATISQASRILYLGIENGAVVLVSLSEFDKDRTGDVHYLSYMQHFLQSNEITKMIVTPTNQLITGNSDGCLTVYDIPAGACPNYECPHPRTDFLLGSFSLLRFVGSARKLNEATLRNWYSIKEFMVNERFMKWVDVNYATLMDDLTAVETKFKEIDQLRNYYNTVWTKMDSFWVPQASREADINNHYVFYDAQFRDKENDKYEGWTRGLWHLEHIDTASKELSTVLDGVMEEMFNKKTIQERYIETYKAVQEDTVKKMQEVRKKVDHASHVYRKLYTLSRNTWNGLHNLMMQEAEHDGIRTFDKDVLKKQYHTSIAPFQEDIRILDKISKKFLDDVKIKAKELVDLTYLTNGPIGITMKLLPNIMNSKFENNQLKEVNEANLCQYLRSQTAQWRELQRWDWVMREWTSLYHQWFMLGQANFSNAFFNSHAYHMLRDEEKLKHLNKKQLSLIHNCSSNYIALSRSLKVVEQFHFECVKIQNDTEMKLSQIDDRISEIPMHELLQKLTDIYDTINKPNKIRKDVFFLKEKFQVDVKESSRIEFQHVCPVSHFLPKKHKLRKGLKTGRSYSIENCKC